MTTRIDRRFEKLKAEGRPALVTYFMGGDPDYDTSLAIMKALPGAGSDVIELGMPFSDPMADGPAIQAAGLRALKGGQTLEKTLRLAREFRAGDNETPIVMMGYYNPIYIYGVDRFLADAIDAGIDGLIVVDLPPEMDEELCLPALKAGINFIRLATPTTDDKRLPKVLENTSGFVYYVSMTGITGSALAETGKVTDAVKRIKSHTELPVCVGFGVKTAEQARVIGASADGVVVGTAIVNAIANVIGPKGERTADPAEAVATMVRGLSPGRAPGAPCFGPIDFPSLSDIFRSRSDELDHQLRPAEDQLDARPPRNAGKPLDQGSGDRRDGLPQGSGEQPVRDPVVRASHEDLGQGTAEILLRQRQVRAARKPESRGRPAEIP